jgi:DNA-binding MarR family transcriptional regulator
MNRDTLIQTIFESMGALKRGMSGQMQSVMQDCPVSRSQLELLATVRHTQPINFKQLAQQLYLTPGSISQLVEALENQGLLQRQTDTMDRRVQTLQLTAQGDKLLATFDQRRRKILEDIMRELTTEELELWLHIQEKITQGFLPETPTPVLAKEA